MSEQQPYSTHSFLLPFRWDYLPPNYSLEKGLAAFSFEQRTNLNAFLANITRNKKWKRKFYRIAGEAKRYNENQYFHAYCTKTIFDLQQQDERDSDVINVNKVMVYFEFKINQDEVNTYEINILKGAIFSLNIKRIALHVYNTGVAILSFNLENYKYREPKQILQINEFGRRIYPQFLSDAADVLGGVKDSFLADSITLKIANYSPVLEDDFAEYADLRKREVHHFKNENYERGWVVQVPKYIRGLFDKEKFCFIQKEEAEGKIRLNLLTDDRMFFVSWFGNDTQAKKLEQNWQKDDFWYAYIFGDKESPSIANNEMKEEHIKRHTYPRWSNYGTLYGMTRDSLVAITSNAEKNYFSTLIKNHIQTMYYQMAVLALAQRASVLRFNAETTMLADLSKHRTFNLLKSIQELYKNYIEFRNKIYFREITPQIQGIEMYEKFQEVMRINENVKDLDEEIQELHNYVSMESQEKISWLATWFLPAGVVVGLMGISAFDEKYTKLLDNEWNFRPYPNAWIWIFIAIMLSLVSGYLVSLYLKFKK